MARRLFSGRPRARSIRRRLLPHRRALRVEPLEDRRVLAVMTVTDLQDNSLANLEGDGQLSLREAIEAINIGAAVDGIGPTSGMFGVDDEIVFDASLFAGGGQTIPLAAGELALASPATITGPGQELLTIDAQQQSRIFSITAADTTIAGLTLTGGNTGGSGGAIDSRRRLTLNQSTVSGSTSFGPGGGIYSQLGYLVLNHSTVTGNTTTGAFSDGGGIYTRHGFGEVVLHQSTVTGNSTTGDSAYGGGIRVSGNVTLTQSTVSGNYTTARGGFGGGIYAYGDVTLNGSTVSGNYTTGDIARGGGISTSGQVTLTESTVSGNWTVGSGDGSFPPAHGGGIWAYRDVTLTKSVISGNYTAGDGAKGGGIYANGPVMLNETTLSGNHTSGVHAEGGGMFTPHNVMLAESTVDGNYTTGHMAHGGGIWTDGDVTITGSTVSGNRTAGFDAWGGGIYTRGNLAITIAQSTITGNRASGTESRGGGIADRFGNLSLSMTGSIVGGNSAYRGNDMYLVNPASITITANYNLIGDTFGAHITAGTGTGNVLNVDPLVGTLADNGGTTQTHALLAGSPALDAGDSDFMPPPDVDQRGLPRVADGGVDGVRIDIGAYEAQAPPPALPGDYNLNGAVGAADYVLWRKVLGDTGVTPFSGADGNGDGDITEADYGVWTANFGDTLPGAGNGATVAAAIDEAIASNDPATSPEPAFRKSAASDNGIDQAATDAAILLNSAAAPIVRLANSRLPNVERALRTAATPDHLLLVLSPTDEAISNAPIGLLRVAPERQPATDQAVTLHVAFDTWFAELGRSLL